MDPAPSPDEEPEERVISPALPPFGANAVAMLIDPVFLLPIPVDPTVTSPPLKLSFPARPAVDSPTDTLMEPEVPSAAPLATRTFPLLAVEALPVDIATLPEEAPLPLVMLN
jgi:hypothetical protein